MSNFSIWVLFFYVKIPCERLRSAKKAHPDLCRCCSGSCPHPSICLGAISRRLGSPLYSLQAVVFGTVTGFVLPLLQTSWATNNLRRRRFLAGEIIVEKPTTQTSIRPQTQSQKTLLCVFKKWGALTTSVPSRDKTLFIRRSFEKHSR